MAGSYDTDDYAAEPVPGAARKPSGAIFLAAMGVATALFFMQISSIIAFQFGSHVALIAIGYASIVSALVGYGMARAAIATGLGTNLLARQVLGYRGAALLSLLLAISAIVYFSTEAAIMSAAVKASVPRIPLWSIETLIALAMAPLVWFGMSALARFQRITVLLYVALLAAALIVSWRAPRGPEDWLNYLPAHAPPMASGVLAAIGIMNGVIFSIALLTADYARFIQPSQIRRGALLVGVLFQLCCFGFAGLLGLWFSLRYLQPSPGAYFVTMLGAWGIVFVVATQVRINVANLYSGSLALVNMVRQAFDVRASRHVAIIAFLVGAVALLSLDILTALGAILNVIGMFTTSICLLLLVDIYGVRRGDAYRRSLGHTREQTSDWRWSGLLSALAATFCGSVLASGVLGKMWASVASPVAGLLQVVGYVVLVARETSLREAVLPGRDPASVTLDPASPM